MYLLHILTPVDDIWVKNTSLFVNMCESQWLWEYHCYIHHELYLKYQYRWPLDCLSANICPISCYIQTVDEFHYLFYNRYAVMANLGSHLFMEQHLKCKYAHSTHKICRWHFNIKAVYRYEIRKTSFIVGVHILFRHIYIETVPRR